MSRVRSVSIDEFVLSKAESSVVALDMLEKELALEGGNETGNRSWCSACGVEAAVAFGLEESPAVSRNNEEDDGLERRSAEFW